MQIVRERLEIAARGIRIEGEGIWRCGPFEDLKRHLHFEIVLGMAHGKAPKAILVDVRRELDYLSQDMWNIETLFERLEWQRGLWNRGALADSQWGRFAAADIMLFHIEYRSIFDYLQSILHRISDKPGQTDVKSFRALSQKVADRSFVTRLGSDIADLVRRCDWFMLLRKFRDLLAHQGGDAIVFLDKPDIAFQLYEGQYDGQVHIPEMMYNRNVARFDIYAGVFYGYLLWYLDEAARLISRRLGLNIEVGNNGSSRPGLVTAQSWIAKAITAAASET